MLQQVFSSNFLKVVKDITDLVYWIYLYIQLLVSIYFITVWSIKFAFNWDLNILDLLLFLVVMATVTLLS